MFKKHKIYELNADSQLEKYRKLLLQTPIAIIDDEGLPEAKTDGLKRHGYKIEEISDVDQIRQLEAYPIVISDVDGVATKLDPENHGLGLIRLLAKNYPFKGLGVYSGKTHSLPILPEDTLIIQKDDELEKWTEKIDTLIFSVSDPIMVWRRFAKKLIDAGISAYDLEKLEDVYVKSILKGDSPDSIKDLNVLPSTSHLKGVVDSLIANGIFLGISKILSV
ncbi:MAG: hypothetical protein K2H46_00595 [Muribaculaceae bacterium]|nr:hypothetical protein [Muribaculaceae bacterium]